MKAFVQRAAMYAVVLFAAAWPWDVYAYLPWAGLDVTACLALCLVALWLADLVVTRRPRLPFELAWPIAVLLVYVWALYAGGRYPAPLLATLVLLLFAATHRFARSKALAAYCLRATMLSCGCVAAVTLAARFGAVGPTAYSLDTGATFCGPRDVAGGVAALAIGLALALRDAFSAEGGRLRRAAAAVAGLLCAAALGSALVPAAAHFVAWRPPDLAGAGLPGLAASLVATWLVARVMAKLIVARRLAPAPVLATCFAAVAVAGALACLVPTPLRLHHGLLLGLAAAASARKEVPRPWLPAPGLLLIPLACLAALNLFRVYPDNHSDPRNYDVAARSDLAEGRYAVLARRMDFFEAQAPGERRTHLWRAKAWLEQGELGRAATEFVASCREPGPHGQLLPGPRPDEADAFVTALRDAYSSLPGPPAHLGFERALVAASRPKSAVWALRLRVDAISFNVDALAIARVPPGPLIEAVAFLLGDPAVTEHLHDWTSADLLAVLHSAGARIERAPDAAPRDALPLVALAQSEAGSLRTCVIAGASACEFARPARLVTAPATPVWAGTHWECTQNPPLSFRLPGVDGPVAAFEMGPAGTLRAGGGAAVEAVPVSDAVAVTVWLP
ncbi:MAG: hypothetical protein JXR94_21295 [Candidatus Hydrogenedentes bacterium]|nr:hypothetical protein [Candidatus Hydrogenedentota bacterium]